MSANWRRSRKRSNWFDAIKNMDEAKGRSSSKRVRNENSRIRRKPYPYKYRLSKISERRKLKEPEPLIDILEEDDDIMVVAEFIGFKKENLKIQIKNQKLILYAVAQDHKYYKSLNLPKRVIPNNIRTTYKNGVLEIRLKKAVEEKAIDKVAG